MKTNKILSTLGLGLLIAGAGLTASCGDFLDQYSQDLVMAKSVNDLNELLIGDVYLRSNIISHGPSQATMAFVNVLDDDLNTVGTPLKTSVANTAWYRTLNPLFGYITWQQDVRYNYGAANRIDDATTWNTLYTRINHANNIIDIIDDMPRTTRDEQALYHRVKGEAHFLRGQFYFALANLYGKPFRPDSASTDLCVPLKLTSHVEHIKDKPTQFQRASVLQVYDQIVADLLVAEKELLTSPQPTKYRLHRASAEAAQLLLSRVYLYRQAWDKAEEKAQAVIDSRNCSLMGIDAMRSASACLTRENPEVIFSQGANHIAPQTKNTCFSGDPGDFCVSRALYALFDNSDVRRDLYFSISALSDSVRLTRKYERGLELNHISDAWLLRKAEAYLNYAEAAAMQGKETEANRMLNLLRQQRISDYVSQDYTGLELVEQIRTERRRELCFEGHRWFDLRRYMANVQYPWQDSIVRVYNVFSENNAFVTTLHYVLPAGDPSFVFAIPNSVLEFDKVPMPNNVRLRREAVKLATTPPPTLPDLTDDEEEDGTAPTNP